MNLKGTIKHPLKVQSCYFKGTAPMSSIYTPKDNICALFFPEKYFKDTSTYIASKKDWKTFFPFHSHLNVITRNRHDVKTQNAHLCYDDSLNSFVKREKQQQRQKKKTLIIVKIGESYIINSCNVT